MKEKKREHYYTRAKRERFRSRAAYKLLQLQEKFGMISEGMSCVDLGAAPGGWLQVEKSLVGPSGKVFGIDLATVKPIDGVALLKGDATSREILDALKRLAGGRVDVVLSDMSPDISGSYSLDHSRSVELVRSALSVSRAMLRKGGSMVAKLFDGDLTKELLIEVRTLFDTVKVSKPPASRHQSSEVYVVAMGFRG